MHRGPASAVILIPTMTETAWGSASLRGPSERPCTRSTQAAFFLPFWANESAGNWITLRILAGLGPDEARDLPKGATCEGMLTVRFVQVLGTERCY